MSYIHVLAYVSFIGVETFDAFRCRIDNIQSMHLMI